MGETFAKRVKESRDFGLDVGAATHPIGGGLIRKARRGKEDTPISSQVGMAREAEESQKRQSQLLSKAQQAESARLAEEEDEVSRRKAVSARNRQAPRTLLR